MTLTRLLALLLLLASVDVAAHDGLREGFNVRTFSLTNQIGGNEISSLTQTSDGYLWVGTRTGLLRFNGERFVAASDLLPVARPRVQTLYATSDTLYVGTAGRGVFRITAGHVTQIDISAGLADDVVWALAPGVGDAMYVATSGGINVLDGDKVTKVPSVDGVVGQMVTDKNGGAWFVDSSGVLGHIVDGAAVRHDLGGDRVYTMLVAEDGRIWLGTDSGLRVAANADEHFEAVADFDGQSVIAMAQTRAGAIWAATEDGQFWRRTDAGWQHRHFAGRLPDARITTLWVDPQDGLWVGTRAGLAQITGGGVVELGPTLSGPDVWAVTRDLDGTMWMATDGAGISQIDTESLTLVPFPLPLPSAEIWALAPSPYGGLWVGSGDAGAFLIRDGALARHITDLPVPQVWSIVENRNGTVLIGTDGGGLVRITPDGRELFDKNNGLNGNRIWALHQASAEQLWVGTNRGLCAIQAGDIRCYGVADGLPGPAVWSVDAADNQHMWVSTDGGLARVSADGNIVAAVREPLASANVFGVTYDAAGDLWVLSAEGLHRIRRDDIGKLTQAHPGNAPLGRTFGPADGLSNTLSSGAFPPMTLDDSGGLWLATEAGLALVQTDLLRDEEVPVSLRFEAMESDGQAVAFGTSAAALAPRPRVVRIRHAAITYRYPEQALTQYRLRGVTDRWSDPSTDRDLTFSNLPAGDYRLELMLSPNSFGLVASPTALAFSVTPSFLERASVRLVLAALLLLALVWLYRRRVRRMILRHEERERWMERELVTARALAESEHRIQDIFANVTDLLFSVDKDGVIIEANPAARRLLPGCEIGRQLEEMLPHDGVVTSEHQPWRWSVTTSDGILRKIDLRCAAGSQDSRLFVGRDVTDELVLQEQIAASQRMDSIGKLTAGVAHDFNNLLTVIHGNAAMLAEKLADNEGATMASAVVDAAERAADITSKLLSFGRRQTVKPQRVNLNTHLEGMKSLLVSAVEESITVIMTLADTPVVEVDTGLLEQIVLNLVVNARDAIHDRGIIEITTRTVELDDPFTNRNPGSRPGPHVKLSIADTGQGMDPQTVDRAFEPFFSTKHPTAGTGLGLATVYGAVKQCGGSVYIHSELGKGTRIDVYLPIVDRPADPAPPRVPAPATGASESVLVVDDDAQILALTREILERHGYRVTTAGGMGPALQNLTTERFDLLLSDMVMRDGSGTQLLERARALGDRVPALFMSGYSHAHLADLPDLEVDVLTKPFRIEELLQAVRRTLDRSAYTVAEN